MAINCDPLLKIGDREFAFNRGLAFVARPPGFGKTHSLESYYSVAVSSTHSWGTYPTILVSMFGKSMGSEDDFEGKIICNLQICAINNGIDGLRDSCRTVADWTKGVIKGSSEKYGSKVVVLIDDYEIPYVLSLLKNDLDEARKRRAILSKFFSSIGEMASEYIHSLLIVGTSHILASSVYSNIDNIEDRTFCEECGLYYFGGEELLEIFYKEFGKQENNDVFDAAISRCGGYRFSSEEDEPQVNIGGLHQLIADIKGHRPEPASLVQSLVLQSLLSHHDMDELDLHEPMTKEDVTGIKLGSSLKATLFEFGILTIRKKVKDGYMLAFPNESACRYFYDTLSKSFKNYVSL